MHLGKFIHTDRGKIIMSVLMGFGLACLFRQVCKGRNCRVFHAAPLEEIKDKIYKNKHKCVKYVPVSTKCYPNAKIIDFE